MKKSERIKIYDKRGKIIRIIVLFIVMLIIVNVIAIGGIALYASSMVRDRITQVGNFVKHTADYVSSTWDGEHTRSVDKLLDCFKGDIYSIEGICIFNEKGTLDSYGEDDFVTAKEVIIDGFDCEHLYIDNSEDNIVKTEGMEVVFDFSKLFFSDDYSVKTLLFSGDKNLTLGRVHLWLMYSFDDNESVAIKCSIAITREDIEGILIAFFIACGFVLSITIGLIITLISLIKSKKQAMKAVYSNTSTDMHNDLYMEKYGYRILKRGQKAKQKYIIVFLRIMKYREFCAVYGQEEGDRYLTEISKVFMTETKPKEIACHNTDADFSMLLKYDGINEIVNRLKLYTDKIMNVRPEISKRILVGFCEIPDKFENFSELCTNAELAAEMTKTSEAVTMHWFDTTLRAEKIWEAQVENEMEGALEKEEFEVYLQPKYSTGQEVLAGAEALVRWQHPTEGLIAPYKFIPLFEKNGFILKLDTYMLEHVARLQAKWKEQGKQLVPISVNVSRAHFTSENLAQKITQIVDKYEVPHKYIEIEITESAFFDDKDVLLKTVEELRSNDFSISMDDFGSGYSSLNSLKELPLDIVKIDAEFFRGKDDMHRGPVIVEGTINLAKKLDMKIVAEGIETREQVDFLADQGCDLIQGYYFAKPMTVAEFEERAGYTTATDDSENEE